MNFKYHNLVSFAAGVLFLVVLQWFAAPNPVFRFLIPGFLFYLAAVGAYNFWFLRIHNQLNFWVWLRPLLFLLAWFGLYLTIPTVFLRGSFLVLSVGIIFFFEYIVGSIGENILFNQVVLSSFAFFIAIFAAAYYFVNSPSIIYIIAVFLYTLFLTRASFELIPINSRVKWLYAFLLSFFITQLFWVISFLPLHFSALGFFALDVFYFVWVLSYYYLLNNLTAKKIQFNAALMIIIFFAILISTPWNILVS